MADALMSRNRARLAIGAGLLALVVGLVAAAVAFAGGNGPATSTEIQIDIHYSHFEPSTFTVPVGVPVTITIVNHDPIGHEWIVGDAAVQAKHRAGKELLHPTLPTEQVIPAGETRVTTITFEASGTLQYICHLPGHEAYGMVGTVAIR